MSKNNKCVVFLLLLGLSGLIAVILSVGYKFIINPTKVKLGCDQNEFKCTENGKCISKEFRCDGQIDCPYKSDELNCPIELQTYAEPDHHSDYETKFPGDHKKSNQYNFQSFLIHHLLIKN